MHRPLRGRALSRGRRDDEDAALGNSCGDLRGHGASPLPDAEFGLDELVADLERVRERSGFERVHVAGHSLGGMIGPAYARTHPERVLSLGLLSTAAGRTEDDSAKVWAVVQAMVAVLAA